MEFFNIDPNPVYGINNPIGLKLLSRLRVGLSHLRSHKYQHRFDDTLSDTCTCFTNKSETVDHFLFHCPKYALLRSELFEKLRKIISLVTLVSPLYFRNLLLYGSSIYKPHTNREIVELTISFLISSSRFNGPLFTNGYFERTSPFV